MVDRATDHLADPHSRQFLELSELEHFSVLVGESSETFPERFGCLTSRHQPIRRNRWLSPRAVGLEACIKHFVHRVRQILARMSVPPFLGLVVKGPEQPRSHF